jgi:uncharacterized repeat protein (TIGR02543 family)
MKRCAIAFLSFLLVLCFALPASAGRWPLSSPTATDAAQTGAAQTGDNQTEPLSKDALPTDAGEKQTPEAARDTSPADSLMPEQPLDKAGIGVIDEQFKPGLSQAQKKLDGQLLMLSCDEFIPEGQDRQKLILEMKNHKQILSLTLNEGTKSEREVDAVNVYVRIADGFAIDDIKPFVIRITDRDEASNLACAQVDVCKLGELAQCGAVQSLQTVLPPVAMSGAIQSQGDGVLKAAAARAQFGIDGTGKKIGVISDGVNSIADAIAAGELPGSVQVLEDDYPYGGDEGTAMLEIVHDLAPGASLYFHDCGENLIAFNEAITDLVNAGCDIIVDDISWITEPFFEDGVIARHVDEMLGNRNIIYVTSAGNMSGGSSDKAHYQGTYRPDPGDSNYHDFSNGTSIYTDLYVNMPTGSTVIAVLQWKEPFGEAASDYDLYLYNNSGTFAWSIGSNIASGDPIEYFAYTNSGTAKQLGITVKKYSAPVAKELEVFVFCMRGASRSIQNVTPGDSIFGHAAVNDVISVGAVGYSAPTSIQPYSSLGPVTMLNGTRSKPEIVATDGVSVSGAGGFGSMFYGTSASAPHVAAIAALTWQRFPSLPGSAIRQMVEQNAGDLGAAGFDSIYGYGIADALRAAQSHAYVRFDTKGGSGVADLLVKQNEKIGAPSSTRPGYSLVGWYRDPGYVNRWNFNTDTVTADMTLYANWTDSVAVTANVQNAAQGSATGSGMYGLGASATVTAIPANGFRFDRWMDGAAAASYSAVYTFTVSAPRTLTAHFAQIGTPRLLSATPVNFNTVRIAFTAVPGASGYDVYRSGFSNKSYVKVASVGSADLTYTDTGLVSGKRVYYKVAASCTAGATLTSGPLSNCKSATPKWPKMTLYSSLIGYHTASLSWNRVEGVESYEVWRKAGPSGYALYKTVTETSLLDDGLLTGTSYAYKVRAVGNTGSGAVYGPFSRVRTVKARWPKTALRAIVQNHRSVLVSFTAVTGAQGYEVWRSTAPNAGYALIGTLEGSLSLLDCGVDGLSPNTTYYYKVRAYQNNGDGMVFGPFSSTKRVKTAWKPLALTALATGTDSIRLSWNTVSGAQGYEVYRSDTARGPYVKINTADLLETFYADSGLTAGKKYYYKVLAFDTIGGVRVLGPFSRVKYAKTLTAAP